MNTVPLSPCRSGPGLPRVRYFSLSFLLAVLGMSSGLRAVESLPPLPTTTVKKTDYWDLLERRWKIIEPVIFTPQGTGYIGERVRFSGKPTSLQKTIVIQLKGGTVVRLQNVQKIDRAELATFRKAPGVVIVEGPITAIDPSARTVTIKADSTSF